MADVSKVVTEMDPSGLEAERPRLVAIAARILGSTAEADDVVQEAWLRLSSADDVDDPPAWLTTVVTRLCLDLLRKQATRSRYEAVAPSAADRDPVDPEADALVADRVGKAMAVVLDLLTPAERAAFVLHDVFGYPFDDVSTVLGRSDAAVRQLASRARRKVLRNRRRSRRREPTASGWWKRSSMQPGAARLATLLQLLAPEAVMRADRVGQRMGAPASFDGAAAVAGRFEGAQGAAPATIDGELGAAWITGSTVKVVFVFHVEDGLIREIELVADPEVLITMDVVPAGAV